MLSQTNRVWQLLFSFCKFCLPKDPSQRTVTQGLSPPLLRLLHWLVGSLPLARTGKPQIMTVQMHISLQKEVSKGASPASAQRKKFPQSFPAVSMHAPAKLHQHPCTKLNIALQFLGVLHLNNLPLYNFLSCPKYSSYLHHSKIRRHLIQEIFTVLYLAFTMCFQQCMLMVS